ncbi:unnamed protein product [Ostreobium quekettii]|uniref:Photosystem II 10 kDa polypeptide, chloroplastic n=1 Tax=Ostreobium quekettii TaxID=121088 RepID=A0A8S1JHA4_9CHLO|nr:unnamed protein product [Ostreobium quekettii]
MASTMTSSAFTGTSLKTTQAARSKSFPSLTIVASGSKTNISKQGLNSVKNKVVKQNLMGIAPSMEKKGWVDAQGRKGKGKGVYQFAKKYGANVDGYSPIYTPDIWSDTGDSYSLGPKGLIAWWVALFISQHLIFASARS